MGKKISTEDCIERCKAFYGDLYTYERFQYTRQKEKSVVTCRIHGDFLTLYSNFVKGHGCKQCSNLVKSRTKTKVLVNLFQMPKQYMVTSTRMKIQNISQRNPKLTLLAKVTEVF